MRWWLFYITFYNDFINVFVELLKVTNCWTGQHACLSILKRYHLYRLTVQTAARKLKRRTRLIAVGVGLDNPKELYTIASAPVPWNVILVPTTNKLNDEEARLINVMINGSY